MNTVRNTKRRIPSTMCIWQPHQVVDAGQDPAPAAASAPGQAPADFDSFWMFLGSDNAGGSRW